MTDKGIKYINDFDIIDYKRPIGKADDMRTSTYRAHYYLNDTNMRNVLQAKLTPSKTYTADHVLERSRISDYKDNYLWPQLETGLPTNPKLGFTQQFMKTFDERKLKFLKRPMRPPSSTAHQDYQWCGASPKLTPTPIKLPTPIATTKILINRCSPGYAKYLDPSATTSRLDYCGMSPAELSRSIARHDNITFWNWSKLKLPTYRVVRGADSTLCDNMPSKDCPKRRCEFPSQVKRVPNTGMTTEVRDNYIAPLVRPNLIIDDTTHIRNIMVHSKQLPSPKDTDYRLLTSGERVQKYV